ncbi:Kunitz/Bovine pancreatic trypsin inhibitor domain protein, partial [Ostertagia ostertagi]
LDSRFTQHNVPLLHATVVRLLEVSHQNERPARRRIDIPLGVALGELCYVYTLEGNQCRKWLHGGCRGNGNNFPTRKECEDKCLKHQPPPVLLLVYLANR